MTANRPTPHPTAGPVAHDVSLLGDDDLHLFNEGTHRRLYEKLGAQPHEAQGRSGVCFAVWAPNARAVSAIGDFNAWDARAHPLRPRAGSGLWEGFVPGAGAGQRYKYHIVSNLDGQQADKADPLATRAEVPPRTASVVWPLDHAWSDADWLAARAERHALDAPVSIYEVHLGSWMRVPEAGNRPLTYRELAPKLARYAVEMGFTHVEFLPVTEHPFYGSWGYQCTGYFAPTSRYGTPQDFMALIDTLHGHGIGVILDWVPSHFPGDAHGLARFDGTHLYEHADPRQGVHPDWDSCIFNYGRNEVRSFLLSSALFWLDRYHVDGLRVDAVASMLYLDYSRRPGEWIPNPRGGNENLDAIGFLRALNEAAYEAFPGVQTYAEESTAWPQVSRPVSAGGLGFGYKWDMGWMHDTLSYLSQDPVYRKHHHGQLTFRALYAFHENFVLPLSHDEVVHGKRSLLAKMPGDEWQRFANLRLLLATLFAQPGKKLLFMGGELAQPGEWRHEASLDWHLLERPAHLGVQRWVRALNALYRERAALHARDCDPAGFEWIDCHDAAASLIALARRGPAPGDVAVVALNHTPVVRRAHRLGVPLAGPWREALNSDAPDFGGSGQLNPGELRAEPRPHHGQPCSLALTLPPLGALFLVPAGAVANPSNT